MSHWTFKLLIPIQIRKFLTDCGYQNDREGNWRVNSKMKIWTWCDCIPSQTPTWTCYAVICVEWNHHWVCPGPYNWRQEEGGFGLVDWGVSAALLEKCCPIPISDFDKVKLTGGVPPHSKGGELKPQNFSALHLNGLRFVEVMGIVARVIWWGNEA